MVSLTLSPNRCAMWVFIRFYVRTYSMCELGVGRQFMIIGCDSQLTQSDTVCVCVCMRVCLCACVPVCVCVLVVPPSGL